MISIFALLTVTSVATTLEPRIELYTMGQGEYLFERYGHAAVCVVYDQMPSSTRCYNYGTTDFDMPPLEMGWDFLRGTSRFWVSVSSRKAMLRVYQRSDRSVWRQRLPLDLEQARHLAELLAHDAKEENRYYVYHHFRDNCSTRVRDLIDEATGGALSARRDRIGLSYRDLGRLGLGEHTVALLASDFLVGRAADHELDRYESMFLPRYLRWEVAENLGVEPEVIYTRQGPPLPQEGSSGRLWVVLLAALLAAALLASRAAGRCRRVALAVSGGLLGLMALVIWLVAAVSSVPELRYNEALLVYIPADLLLFFLRGRRLHGYAWIRLGGLVLVAVLLALEVLEQPLLVPMLVPALVFAAIVVRLPRRLERP